MADFMSQLLWIMGIVILIYMTVVVGFYSVLTLTAFIQLRKERQLDKYEDNEEYLQDYYTKPVSILIPAYNEEAGIIESIRSLLSLQYPQKEMIIINDGSTDHTVERVISHFRMEKIELSYEETLSTASIKAIYQSKMIPSLLLVDKENGGKADALNAGMNVSNYPYFCSIDGDSILEQDALLKVMKPIMKSGEEVIASGGSVRVANGCEIQMGKVMKIGLSNKPLVIMQVIEYLRAFFTGRIGLSRHNLLLINSGAFSVFSKKWAMAAGGYSNKTVGEDMELVVRLHRYIREQKQNKRIVFVSDPVCWTEAPETLKQLGRQRSRWHRGLIESLWTHRKMTLNPRYGVVGTVSFPYYWLVEMIGPIMELLGYAMIIVYLLMGGVYLEFAALLMIVMVVYGSIFSMVAVLLEAWSLNRYTNVRDLVTLFLFSLFETFWFRPLTVIWRFQGCLQWMFKYRKWDTLERKGLNKMNEHA
ncbi:glycosyltransferase [Halalkalibacter sp. AB-rgal2]|uniref:glycosyltransferase family 2 protein n=1 Tax=Halalkalibacter sp. AB-rgal2 TaxID=3242695 RepID=UPI00359DA8A8